MRATHRDISRSNEHIRFELLDCPECIYLSENGKCVHRVGKVKCIGVDCPFRTTARNEKEQELSWKERLCSLSENEQNKIAEKYYGGKMPWRVKK